MLFFRLCLVFLHCRLTFSFAAFFTIFPFLFWNRNAIDCIPLKNCEICAKFIFLACRFVRIATSNSFTSFLHYTSTETTLYVFTTKFCSLFFYIGCIALWLFFSTFFKAFNELNFFLLIIKNGNSIKSRRCENGRKIIKRRINVSGGWSEPKKDFFFER